MADKPVSGVSGDVVVPIDRELSNHLPGATSASMSENGSATKRTGQVHAQPLVPTTMTAGASDIQVKTQQAAHHSVLTRNKSMWERRMQLWEDEDEGGGTPKMEFAPGSIRTLPIGAQAMFRRRVLTVFSLQLVLLTAITALLTYEASLNQLMRDAFPTWKYVLIALAVMATLLVVLYRVHAKHPWNWLALVLFSVSFSVFIVSIQVVLDTNAGFFCCVINLSAVCIMTVLCGVTRGSQSTRRFFSATAAGMISFAIVAVVACIVASVCDWYSLTGKALAYSLVLEWMLIMWFSYDATVIFSLLTPDEYMHGVIYFYTDVVLLFVFSAVIGSLFLICSAASGNGGGGMVGMAHCNCTGCYGCRCCQEVDQDTSAVMEAGGGAQENANMSRD